jgi:hypothetical protein
MSIHLCGTSKMTAKYYSITPLLKRTSKTVSSTPTISISEATTTTQFLSIASSQLWNMTTTISQEVGTGIDGNY